MVWLQPTALITATLDVESVDAILEKPSRDIYITMCQLSMLARYG
jgi:hypothetical protein